MSLSTLREVAYFAVDSAERLIAQLPADEEIVAQTIHIRGGEIVHICAYPTDALVEEGDLIDAICADAYQRRPEFIVSLNSHKGDEDKREIMHVSCFDRLGQSIGAKVEFERGPDSSRVVRMAYGECSDDKLAPGLAGTMLLIGAGEAAAAA